MSGKEVQKAKEDVISFDPSKWKPITKEQLEEVYGKLESYTWKSYTTGKTLRVWFRPCEKDKFSEKGEEWMNFLYALTIEEVDG